MQRIVPEIILQLDAAFFVEIILLAQGFVLAAIVRRVFVNGCFRVGFWVVYHFVKEGVRVEVEDCGVWVCDGKVVREGEEAGIPV